MYAGVFKLAVTPLKYLTSKSARGEDHKEGLAWPAAIVKIRMRQDIVLVMD
jgi:hypothetical protein